METEIVAINLFNSFHWHLSKMAVLVILVLLSCFSSSSMLVLDCSFQNISEKVYACLNANMEVIQKEMNIQELSGVHLKDKENVDVTDLYLMSNRLSFLPRNWTTHFPNLKTLFINGHSLILSAAKESDDDLEVENTSKSRSYDDIW